MKNTEEEALRRMSRAREQLLYKEPFWGVRAGFLRFKADNRVPRFATDDRYIFFNPEYVLRAPEWELMFGVAHETDHNALGHILRMLSRTQKRWNVATDYQINLSLADAGFRVPENVYINERFRGWTADQIYAYLLNEEVREQEQRQQEQQQQEQQQQEQQQTDSSEQSSNEQPQDDNAQSNEQRTESESTKENDAGDASSSQTSANTSETTETQQNASGEQESTPEETLLGPDGKTPCTTGQMRKPTADEADSESDDTMSAVDWQIATEQAIRVAQKAGKLPGNVVAQVEAEIRSTQTDWASLMREFFTDLNPTDYTFMVRDRRYSHIYLPGMQNEELGEVVWAFDTSASVGHHIFDTFASEFAALVDELQPKTVWLVQCDAEIQSTREWQSGDDVSIRRAGYGGTRFRPVFDWVEEQSIAPAALVYLTDLECYDMPEDPGYPVLWVTPEWIRKEAPFGRTVRIQTA